MNPWLMFAIGVAMFSSFTWYTMHDERQLEKFIKNQDVKLNGIVTRIVKTGAHDGGLIDIDVIHSDKEYIDPRDSVPDFFCIIKNKKAEVVMSIYETIVGDSIEIDTKRDSVWDYRDNRLVYGTPIPMTQEAEVYFAIRDFIRL